MQLKQEETSCSAAASSRQLQWRTLRPWLHGADPESAHAERRSSAAICLANRSLTLGKMGDALSALRDAQRWSR